MARLRTRPHFSKEQLKFLREALTPECCHVSGMHDPEHFEKRPNVICEFQFMEAYQNFLKLMHFKLMRGRSKTGCGWCALHKIEKEKKK